MPDTTASPIDSAVTGTRTLLDAYESAIELASPQRCLTAEHIPPGELTVLGTGKAAASMALTVNELAPGRARGVVVTRYEHGLRDGESSGEIEILEAAHPLPDAASATAGRRLLEVAGTLGSEDTLLFLVSGGGSALSIAPLAAVTLEQKREATDFLMRAGADIRDINCVRRHLSALKGGRLAQAAHPARAVTLAISDVPGDSIGDIASGPTIPDSSTAARALEILSEHDYPGRAQLVAALSSANELSPGPYDPDFVADTAKILASSQTALNAAQKRLESAGYIVHRLGDHLTDVARDLGREHAKLAVEYANDTRPVAMLSGGETRVVVTGKSGRGGRNLEYLAALVLELDGQERVVALAADTDGIDGNGDHAGAVVTSDALSRGLAAGVDLSELLDQNDTYRYFQACKLLLVTGPTRTNVNDFRLILINPIGE
ncbi:MAG: glycerate kinase [Candidatus Rariloculaceae bacterium]